MVVDVIHGAEVPGPYRGLEDAADPATVAWSADQDRRFEAARATWPQRDAFAARVDGLFRTGFGPISVGRDALTYPFFDASGGLYVLTNDGAPRWRVCRVDGPEWTDVVPEDPAAVIGDVTVHGVVHVQRLHHAGVRAARRRRDRRAGHPRPILLRRETGVGHAGRAISRDVDLAADELAFLAAQLSASASALA